MDDFTTDEEAAYWDEVSKAYDAEFEAHCRAEERLLAEFCQDVYGDHPQE